MQLLEADAVFARDVAGIAHAHRRAGDDAKGAPAGLIAAGRTEGTDWLAIDDRSEAISHAIRLASPGDLVLITGKGHEQSMCFGTVETPWSDVDAARAILRERFGA